MHLDLAALYLELDCATLEGGRFHAVLQFARGNRIRENVEEQDLLQLSLWIALELINRASGQRFKCSIGRCKDGVRTIAVQIGVQTCCLQQISQNREVAVARNNINDRASAARGGPGRGG